MPEYTAAIQEFVRINGLWLIPFFPAMGAFINLVFGALIQKRFGKTPIHVVAVGTMVLSSLTALYFFAFRLLPLDPSQRFLLDDVFPMINLGAVRINMAFAMDPLGGVMACMVTVVATAIHIYSTGYMHDEPSYWRFFGYLNLFCFSMLMLVLGENFLLMFFGWEGVGLCSYLLIGFWYKDKLKAAAGMKAFIVNRVGDFGFVVGMLTLFWGLLGVWDTVSTQVAKVDDGRCVAVKAAALPIHHGATGAQGAHGDPHQPATHPGHTAPAKPGHTAPAKPGHTAPAKPARPDIHHGQPAKTPKTGGHSGLNLSLIGTAHAADGHGAHGAPAVANGAQRGRCGAAVAGQIYKEQPPSVVGSTQQVYVGPTVSFREIKDQLSIKNGAGDHVVAKSLQGAELFGIALLIFATFGFFIGAMGKSAQIPLYIWLPDAMAGPTPVSALIHAATMVTAGVYMVARLNFIFILSPEGMTLVACVGALTAVFAATIGLFQYDIKKVLAYSTVSQLGYMFIGVGVGAYWVGVYHLITHAFFKACLFLGSGSVIHGMHWVEHEHGHHDDKHPPKKYDQRVEPNPADPQDMRNMGGLAKLMPSTRWTYLIACFAIAGVPGFSGFFSKDEILWKAFSTGNLLVPGQAIWALGALGAVCTAFYMFRSYYMTFHGRAPTEAHKHHVHESPRSMTWVLWFLAAGAVLTGVLGLPMLWTGQEPIFEQFLAPTMATSNAFQQPATVHGHGIEWTLMLVSVGLAVAGILFARFWYKDMSRTAKRLEALKSSWRSVHTVIFNKYYVDEIYQATVIRGFMALTRALAWFDLRCVDGLVNATSHVLKAVAMVGGFIDRWIVDGAVNLVATVVLAVGGQVRRVQTGRINSYVTGVAFGVVVLLFVVWISTPLSGK